MNGLGDILRHPVGLTIGVPLLTGLIGRLLPRAWRREQGIVAVAGTAVAAMLAWRVFAAGGLMPGAGPWLVVDGLSRFVLAAVATFGFLIALFSLGHAAVPPVAREYYAYLAWTVGIACGAVLANDLILLLVLWGLLGLTLYVMIGLSGPDASAAAKKSFVIVGGSDCLLMLGIVIVWLLTGSTRMNGPVLPFTGGLTYAAFLCFAAAALAKAGAVPVHSWVPDCGEKALAPVTAFLPASLDKLLGIYLLARVTRGMFAPDACMNLVLMAVGAVTVVAAVMMALVQHDLKRLLSYHAVSQVGYMVLGIGAGTPLGLAGGLFHMLNNAVYKSALFLCAGAVEEKAGTTDLDRLGGLARAMPATFATCLTASLAISGIPPLNGFFSKWMVYQGIVQSAGAAGPVWVVWLAAAMIGSALTLASFAKVLHAVFLCKPAAGTDLREAREVNWAMRAPMLALAAVCVLFGVLAVPLPLRTMILPAAGGDTPMIGVWWSGTATAMMAAAFVFGLLLYAVSRAGRARECATYVGGETLGAGAAPAASVEVTGVDFYRTIEEMQPLQSIYAAAGKKLFDLYDVGTSVLFYFVEALRKAHGGVLPVYLTWVLAGLLILVWRLAQ